MWIKRRMRTLLKFLVLDNVDARELIPGPHGDSLVTEREALYAKLGRGACHSTGSQVHAPTPGGLYGSTVLLRDGRVVTADDDYLRKSISRPRDDVVTGYEPIMPSYAALTDSAGIKALVAYVKSLPKGDER
jgi:cytochrome c oxidase subunit 2